MLQSYQPGLILVSAGFDGTAGHPTALGGYSISPSCFGILTSYLMQLVNGKVISTSLITDKFLVSDLDKIGSR